MRQKVILTALFIALSFVLSTVIVFPNMAPIQHVMNVLGAVFLGPWYNALSAFLSGGLRMVMGGRPFIATSGWVGALLSGLVYHKTQNKTLTVITEIVGSGILSAILYYFPMKWGFGMTLPNAFYFVPFFFPSAGVGAILGGFVLQLLEKRGLLYRMVKRIE